MLYGLDWIKPTQKQRIDMYIIHTLIILFYLWSLILPT